MDETASLAKDLPSLAEAQQKAGNKRKRQIVTAACERCRALRRKCDGLRPQCTKCTAAHAECVYTVPVGQTRHDVEKARLEKMKEDFESMREVLDLLRSSNTTAAEQLLDRMRDSEDSLAFARTYASQQGSSPLRPQKLLTQKPLDPRRRHDSTYSSHFGSQSPPALTSAPSMHFEPSLPGREPSVVRPSELPAHLDIPAEHNYRDAIASFHECSGKLFHVCDEGEIEASFDHVFHNPHGNPPSAISLCRLSALAAVGCLYMKGKEGDKLKHTFYHIAKSLLDSCIETDPLIFSTFCTLVSMYNIMSRATVALVYIELGISLCRRFQIHTVCRPPTLSEKRWKSGKRAWRTLIFFGAWIPATIGYLSPNEWDIPGEGSFIVVERSAGADLEDMVQIEMVKIAVLKRNILHINMAFPRLAANTIKTVKKDLERWYHELPPIMHLTNLTKKNNSSGVSAELRRTLYFVHLLYLGALILLNRRVAVQSSSTELNDELSICSGVSVDKLADDSAIAAQQSARILGLLIDEGGVFERCWIVIFQAYSAGIILLHRFVQDNLQPTPSYVRNGDNLDCIDKCMRVLGHCGSVDPVASKFEKTLRPFYATLRAAYDKLSSRLVPNLKKMEGELYRLVVLPPPSDRVGENDCTCNQADGIGVALHSHVDWLDCDKSTPDPQQIIAHYACRPVGLVVDTITKSPRLAHVSKGFQHAADPK